MLHLSHYYCFQPSEYYNNFFLTNDELSIPPPNKHSKLSLEIAERPNLSIEFNKIMNILNTVENSNKLKKINRWKDKSKIQEFYLDLKLYIVS